MWYIDLKPMVQVILDIYFDVMIQKAGDIDTSPVG
jgi:hypothetical protein